MHPTLDALRNHPVERPNAGQVRVLVARHAAPTWPSPEVEQMARARATAIHQLDGLDGVEVIDWGETDGQFPREVVDVLLQLASTIVPALATVLAAWVTTRRGSSDTREDGTPVAGIRVVVPSGREVVLTYRDASSDEGRAALEKELETAAAGPERTEPRGVVGIRGSTGR